MNPANDDYLERARRLHEKALVIDTHCDTTLKLQDPAWSLGERHPSGHVDLPRLREGGVDAVFFAVWAPGPLPPGEGVAAARARIHEIEQTVERFSGEVAPARSADDVREARAGGRVAILIAIEGGYLIEDSLDTLREFHARGATYLTLTHSFHTNWADSSGVHQSLDPRHGGLTAFGREVVEELNRLGMMVDVSHASDDTVGDVLAVSAAPIVATHSSCRALCPHRRNLTDDMIRAIADTGGVVQINFAAAFIDPDYPNLPLDVVKRWMANHCRPQPPLCDHVTPLSVLADHFDHALSLVGPDHVGIGTDFDGVPALPDGMEDCSKLPYLTAELLRRGYQEADLQSMLGENVLRVMKSCQDVANTKCRSGSGAASETT